VPCEISDPKFSLGLHDDPEMIERQLVTSYHQHYVGKLDQIGLLFNFSETPAVIQGPPLVVGEHTEQILRELGYGTEEIAALHQSKSVTLWSPESDKAGFPASPWMPQPPAAQETATAK
jgi:hypothetical protein